MNAAHSDPHPLPASRPTPTARAVTPEQDITSGWNRRENVISRGPSVSAHTHRVG
jgi:hypothetical protein